MSDNRKLILKGENKKMKKTMKSFVASMVSLMVLITLFQVAAGIRVEAKGKDEVELTIEVKFTKGDPVDVKAHISSENPEYSAETLVIPSTGGKIKHYLKKEINQTKMAYSVTLEVPEGCVIQKKATRPVNMGTKNAKTRMTFSVENNQATAPDVPKKPEEGPAVNETMNQKFTHEFVGIEPVDISLYIFNQDESYKHKFTFVSYYHSMTYELSSIENGEKQSYRVRAEVPEGYEIEGETERAITEETLKNGIHYVVKKKVDESTIFNLVFDRDFQENVTPVNAKLFIYKNGELWKEETYFDSVSSTFTIMNYPVYEDGKPIVYTVAVQVPDSYYLLNAGEKKKTIEFPVDSTQKNAVVKFTIGQEREHKVDIVWKNVSPEELQKLSVMAKLYRKVEGQEKEWQKDLVLNAGAQQQYEWNADFYTINDYGTIDKKIEYHLEVEDIQKENVSVMNAFQSLFSMDKQQLEITKVKEDGNAEVLLPYIPEKEETVEDSEVPKGNPNTTDEVAKDDKKELSQEPAEEKKETDQKESEGKTTVELPQQNSSETVEEEKVPEGVTKADKVKELPKTDGVSATIFIFIGTALVTLYFGLKKKA